MRAHLGTLATLTAAALFVAGGLAAAGPASADALSDLKEGPHLNAVNAVYFPRAATALGGDAPEQIKVSPDGSTLYVLGGTGSAYLLVLDAATGAVRSRVDLGTGDPGEMAVSPDGSRLYVSLYAQDQVAVLDAAGHLVSAIPTDESPNVVALSADGSKLFVDTQNDLGEEYIDEFSTASGAKIGKGDLGTIWVSAMTVDRAGADLWITDADGGQLFATRIVSIETSTNGTIGTPVGSAPCALAQSPDRSELYVGNADSQGTLNFIPDSGNDVDNAPGSVFLGGANPCALAATPDGTTLFVGQTAGTSSSWGGVESYDAKSGALIGRVGILETVDDLALSPDGQHLYVIDHSTSSLTAQGSWLQAFDVSPAWLATPTPTIVGSDDVGSTVSVSFAGWRPAPVGYDVTWTAGSTTLGTAPTLRIPASALGKRLTAAIRIPAAGHLLEQDFTVSPAGVVGHGTLKPGTPKIAGSAAAGKTLAVHPGTWSPKPALAFHWYANGVLLPSLTGKSKFRVAPALAAKLAGKRITVKVVATLKGYTTRTVTSHAFTVPPAKHPAAKKPAKKK